ncbi:GntR family transcriptional regulator [Marispirochaeta sp.]|jgi:DNA-binding GntR family transcriptional regulator|uniref:GntR family transcriptional regulator n=1 Tax=Marispirochaeta sp. TaxID=2038653 RepID=UPI0029C897E5|nr:GntR family transcriptional regulator [Marispirochaeta sp.]
MLVEVEDDFRSSSDKAYEKIFDLILTGQLKPGEKLIRRKLAEKTGVSTIPVMEALLRLEALGIVESIPYRGSRVVPITKEKVRDWYALREAIECQVVRIISRTLTDDEIEGLEKLAVQLDTMEQAGDTESEQFWELHFEMHMIMAKKTGHQSLIDSLHRINLFRLLQRAQYSATEHKNQIPQDNHHCLIDALRTRDPLIAEEAMREHIYHSGILA